MKTEDLIQLGVLGVLSYVAWQKFGKKGPATKPSTATIPITTPVDFGVTNPDDASWGDSPQGITFVQQILGDVL